MKHRSNLFACACACALLTAPSAFAITYYWDTNGSTTGGSDSSAADGFWNGRNWSNNSAGTSSTSYVTTANTDTVIFSAGTNVTGSSSVSLGVDQVVGNITFEEGAVTISGNKTLTLGNSSGNAVITANNYQDSITSVIAGASNSLTKSGTGMLYLTAANTYTGATVVSAGFLFIQNGSNLGSTGNGTSVTAGATLALTGGVTIGDEALTINGIGRNSNGALFSLNGNNTYGGTITLGSNSVINSGGYTLSLTSATAISGNYGLTFTGAGNTIVTSAIETGTGGLVKSGSGTLTLSGVSTYTGGTTVVGGSLKGTTASIQGAVVNNAAVEFNQADNGTYAGAMSGTGSLSKTDVGVLTLSGANTYAGGTTVSAGSLKGTSASIQGAVVNNAAVEFNQADNGTYAGVMSGTGSLSKTDGGTLTLTGNNTYAGATTVAGGSLLVNGALANTALTVQTGALLGGSGSIGSGGATVAIQSGGSLSPGNSPGMLTVNGSLTLSLGSIYNYQLISGSALADSVDVNGALTLENTTLSLTNLGTYTAKEKFTLFAYESLTGTFDGLADGTTFTAGGGDWLINYNDTTGGLNNEAVGTSYVTITAVPEPSSLALLALSSASLLFRRRAPQR